MKVKTNKKLFQSNKLAFIGTLFVVVGIGASYLLVTYALANAQNTYTDIYMPASNLTNISHDLTINSVASPGSIDYFWSNQFGFSGSGVPSDGGAYIGLQGINRAVFSVFDYASTEAPSYCNISQDGFDGYTGESGTSCILSYTVTPGHTYQLQVSNEGQDSQGINWLGEVTDLTTGQTTTIATINVPASWGNLSGSMSAWTEWFGDVPSSCSALPYSNVTFSNFTANNGQYSAPSSHVDTLQTGTGCSGYSQIVDNNNNSFTQIMGINPPVSETIVPYNPPATSAPVTPKKAAPAAATSTSVPTTKPITQTASSTTKPMPTPSNTAAAKTPTPQTTKKPLPPVLLSVPKQSKKPIALVIGSIGLSCVLIAVGAAFIFHHLFLRKRIPVSSSDPDINALTTDSPSPTSPQQYSEKVIPPDNNQNDKIPPNNHPV